MTQPPNGYHYPLICMACRYYQSTDTEWCELHKFHTRFFAVCDDYTSLCGYKSDIPEVKEEVVNTNPTAHAGYFKTDPYVDRLIKQGIVKELK